MDEPRVATLTVRAARSICAGGLDVSVGTNSPGSLGFLLC